MATAGDIINGSLRLLGVLAEGEVPSAETSQDALNAMNQAAEAGLFPPQNTLRWVKCGAAPLAPELARRFQIRSIPTLVLLANGAETDRMSGAMSAADLKRWLLAR